MKNIVLFVSLALFLITLNACNKKDDSRIESISKISSLKHFLSPYSDAIYLYSRLSGQYKYNGNRLDTIVVETTNPRFPTYNFLFHYRNDGKISKYEGCTLPGNWSGPYVKYFHYDKLGRVDLVFSKDNKKEGRVDSLILIYDNNNRIIEYWEKTSYENSRKFIYTWDGSNISKVKVINLSYYGSGKKLIEAIVKFKYDSNRNPFKQENFYLFRPRYLSSNNPISDTTIKYTYESSAIDTFSLKSIDTIVNLYDNTFNSGQLISIKKNGKLLDIIEYIDVPK